VCAYRYFLQDAQNRLIQPELGFLCVKEVTTVYSFLEEREALELRQDPRALIATPDITDGGGRRSREEVAADVLMKRMAAEELKQRYASPRLPAEEIQRVLDSLADLSNYLNFNVTPVRRMLRLLRDNFNPDAPEKGFSLAIGGGRGSSRSSSSSSSSSSSLGFSMYSYGSSYGSSYFRSSDRYAKLSHDHSTHYTYVRQSLLLWRQIMSSMYKLWMKADDDLRSTTSSYNLLNTGQGLNRVQHCPLVASEMRSILTSVQRECGPWVGLSVVHLGDRDVPNALMFIDKYTQVRGVRACVRVPFRFSLIAVCLSITRFHPPTPPTHTSVGGLGPWILSAD
jgi:hypothetical protein